MSMNPIGDRASFQSGNVESKGDVLSRLVAGLKELGGKVNALANRIFNFITQTSAERTNQNMTELNEKLSGRDIKWGDEHAQAAPLEKKNIEKMGSLTVEWLDTGEDEVNDFYELHEINDSDAGVPQKNIDHTQNEINEIFKRANWNRINVSSISRIVSDERI